MKCFIPVFFLVAILPACSQKVASNDSTFITIKRANYTITSPPSWSIDSSGRMGMDVYLLSPLAGKNDDFRENVNVFVQSLKGMNYDLLRMGKESEVQVGHLMTNVQILESRIDSSSSGTYYLLKYKAEQGRYML